MGLGRAEVPLKRKGRGDSRVGHKRSRGSPETPAWRKQEGPPRPPACTAPPQRMLSWTRRLGLDLPQDHQATSLPVLS